MQLKSLLSSSVFTQKTVLIVTVCLILVILLFARNFILSDIKEEREEKLRTTGTGSSSSSEDSASTSQTIHGEENSKKNNNNNNNCEKIYSNFGCIDNSDPSTNKKMFFGEYGDYGFPIYNRSCLYENIVVEHDEHRNTNFIMYVTEEVYDRLENSITASSSSSKSTSSEKRPTTTIEKEIPRVTLSSRPFDLPHNHRKRTIIRNKMIDSHRWSPVVRKGSIPCRYFSSSDKKEQQKQKETILAYYSPIVAPWNVAHTLLCDLFGLYWAAYELFSSSTTNNINNDNNNNNNNNVPNNLQIVGYGRHYAADFELPPRKYKNVAFQMLSTKPPVYESGLKPGVYGKMIAGIGTKSWSWVTTEYSASGNPDVWYSFRKHIIRTVGISDDELKEVEGKKRNGVVQKTSSSSSEKTKTTKIKVSICYKKDKRGIVNYEETMKFLNDAGNSGKFNFVDDNNNSQNNENNENNNNVQVEFVLETSVGLSVKNQVLTMLKADIYMCNEGTLSTPFFLMSPGKVFLSLPLVYHTPHLHQRRMPKPNQWWRVPDPLRPDPRKNIGGNIDWFPQSIPWIKTLWYDYVPMNETKIQLPLSGLRNYMPDMNIVIQKNRIVPLMQEAVKFVVNGKKYLSSSSSSSFSQIPKQLLTDRPNYSLTANICRQMLKANPNMTKSFNTARCLFGMSWLCEFWANTQYKWRFLHGKWSWRCGARQSSVEYLKKQHIEDFEDPREQRPLSEFLFYSKDELLAMYNDTDFGKLKVVPDGSETKIFD